MKNKNTELKYKGFFDFLKQTPSNLFVLSLMTLFTIFIPTFTIYKEGWENWSIFLILFYAVAESLCIYGFYQLYKRNKNERIQE